MDEKTLKIHAARIVLDGLKRADALCAEAWRMRRAAESLHEPDRSIEQLSAAARFAKAARIRHCCAMIGVAHGVGSKANRPRVATPAGSDEKDLMVTDSQEVAHAR